MTVLRLENISKYYASQTAVVMGLSNVSLSFSEGEFVAVTGENGSGKSTIANVIGGMLPYEGGELYVMGQPTSHYNAADWERYRRDMISFISQDYGILPGNTVSENVESALILSGCSGSLAADRTREILEKVELSEYSGRRAAKLSSGQKQRLAIARALAKPSRILIADEPTGNLDRENSDRVIKLLKEASEERLVILITHEFSEAEEYVTRHIVLSDGKVIQDADLRAAAEEQEQVTLPEPDGISVLPRIESSRKKTYGKSLSSYVARLTAKARPVFFSLTALILILTCISSFIFIGNFIIATDDTTARIYDDSAFINGDPARIVVAKDGKKAFTQEDTEEIAGQRYVRSVERYGYISDVNYFYREDEDYREYTGVSFEDGYDPLENSDAFSYTVEVELLEDLQSDPKFLRSVTQAGAVRNGRMAEGYYEVLSSDPDFRTGDQVRVYIKDSRHWAIAQFIGITFDVVGETSGDRGLFFSENFCRMMNASTLASIYSREGMYYVGGDLGRYPVAPFDAERYSQYMIEVYSQAPASPDGKQLDPQQTAEPVIPTELKENEFVIPPDPERGGPYLGQTMTLSVGAWYTGTLPGHEQDPADSGVYELKCAGQFKSDHPRFILVNPLTYEKMTADMRCNQVSVFIDDYAYKDRVIEELVSLGYVALSPYEQGSTKKDAKLEEERIDLLRISLAASVITLVLQLILLRVIFSSLGGHYRLLSNMGLRAKTAYGSIALLFLFLTVISEIIGAAVILILNARGYIRVVNIFKYLDPPKLLLVFAVHMIFCAIAYVAVVRSIRKQVFTINGFYEDMDGELMEEVMAQ